jgi:hypothetical protein
MDEDGQRILARIGAERDRSGRLGTRRQNHLGEDGNPRGTSEFVLAAS